MRCVALSPTGDYVLAGGFDNLVTVHLVGGGAEMTSFDATAFFDPAAQADPLGKPPKPVPLGSVVGALPQGGSSFNQGGSRKTISQQQLVRCAVGGESSTSLYYRTPAHAFAPPSMRVGNAGQPCSVTEATRCPLESLNPPPPYLSLLAPADCRR